MRIIQHVNETQTTCETRKRSANDVGYGALKERCVCLDVSFGQCSMPTCVLIYCLPGKWNFHVCYTLLYSIIIIIIFYYYYNNFPEIF